MVSLNRCIWLHIDIFINMCVYINKYCLPLSVEKAEKQWHPEAMTYLGPRKHILEVHGSWFLIPFSRKRNQDRDRNIQDEPVVSENKKMLRNKTKQNKHEYGNMPNKLTQPGLHPLALLESSGDVQLTD